MLFMWVSKCQYIRFISKEMDMSNLRRKHDRDMNAARNILEEGLKQIA